jgi:hypothetical protein
MDNAAFTTTLFALSDLSNKLSPNKRAKATFKNHNLTKIKRLPNGNFELEEIL